MNDFTEYLDSIIHKPIKILIAGDFNIHLNDPHNICGQNFLNLIYSYGLYNNVSFSTHQSGQTLNLIITGKHDDLYIPMICRSGSFSDHNLIKMSLNFSKPEKAKF